MKWVSDKIIKISHDIYFIFGKNVGYDWNIFSRPLIPMREVWRMRIFQIFNIIALPLSCTKTHNVPYPTLSKNRPYICRPQNWYCNKAASFLMFWWKYVVGDEIYRAEASLIWSFQQKSMSQHKIYFGKYVSDIFAKVNYLLRNHLYF